MFGEEGCALIKELHRNPGTIPPYNKDLVGKVANETLQLIEHNKVDAAEHQRNRNTGGVSYAPTIRFRHAAIQRNKRCLGAYHYNRIQCLKTMRWEFGSILPPDIKLNLSQSEITWFNTYSSTLAKYMRSLGEDGVNLMVDVHPPKALYIEVKCVVDYGRYELSDGTDLLLKKNSRHYLPRVECEELIRQGVCEHIVN